MASAVIHSLQASPVLTQSAAERATVARLIQTVADAGLQIDPANVVNCYVAVKSKPLAILIGPPQTGKTLLVRSLAQVLTAGDPFRCQLMDGHAWWASRTDDVALFTTAHERLNSAKILALIEEAWQPENTDRVLIGRLTRLSPAELSGLFSGLAFQLRHGQIMRLPAAHLCEPIPYPPNLLMVGTMDTEQFDWSDRDLLSQATIIRWPAADVKPIPRRIPASAAPFDAGTFLGARLRSEASARQKLYHLLGGRKQALLPVLVLQSVLDDHAGELPGEAIDEAIIYLANAWSSDGIGLFAEATPDNLVTAVDFAMAQSLLPPLANAIRDSIILSRQLRERLNAFPQSVAFLEALA
jgi:hypothetical protein